MTPFSPFRLCLATLASAVAAGLVLAPAAHAGWLVDTAPDCNAQVLETPFWRFADPAPYTLVPNGALEQWSKWSFDGGATRDHENEPYLVHDVDDASSLSLPAGSSATTASVCVGIEYPTLRFFVRNRGSASSVLRVEVLYEDAAGATRSLPIAALTAGPNWQPTAPLPLAVNLLPLLPGDRTAVAFRFTPEGAGDWSVDDVYVDPWRHR